MVGEPQRWVQLHLRHVAADAVTSLACVGVHRVLSRSMTGVALLVVIGRIVAARVLMGPVASRTGELSTRITAAFH